MRPRRLNRSKGRVEVLRLRQARAELEFSAIKAVTMPRSTRLSAYWLRRAMPRCGVPIGAWTRDPRHVAEFDGALCSELEAGCTLQLPSGFGSPPEWFCPNHGHHSCHARSVFVRLALQVRTRTTSRCLVNAARAVDNLVVRCPCNRRSWIVVTRSASSLLLQRGAHETSVFASPTFVIFHKARNTVPTIGKCECDVERGGFVGRVKICTDLASPRQFATMEALCKSTQKHHQPAAVQSMRADGRNVTLHLNHRQVRCRLLSMSQPGRCGEQSGNERRQVARV